MMFLELTLPSPEENLALEEVLLQEAEHGMIGEVLRIWEWPSPAIVLGAACPLALDVDQETCRADGVPILRRASGGGTVLLGNGSLCFSLVLSMAKSPELATIPGSYANVLDRIRFALQDRFSKIERAGISDLVIGGRKFSGNAQQRKRTYLLHHGTILYGFDLSAVDRYLRLPERRPEYRESRPHSEFLMNLPISPQELTARLRNEFHTEDEESAVPMDYVQDRVALLAWEKYQSSEWIGRR